MSSERVNRRGLLGGIAAGLGALLGGCDRVPENTTGRKVLFSAEGLTYRVQRFLLRSDDLAREYSEADITAHFRANGTYDPPDSDYRALVRNNFVDWRLRVDGLVDNPLALSLTDLRALPSRTQITRHDCVEGWSCIGEWTGAKLAPIMALAGLKPVARHLVLYCADTLDGAAPAGQQQYYETLDMADVFHPQTILAYAMNGAPLSVPHGAPLRLRAERHLGYKQAKYVMRLEAVAGYAHIGAGKGGFWEDRGYEQYAGI
jgi:DMSO/TMAO reductase YedYZ molybdopterin-dependent catalytic subunit